MNKRARETQTYGDWSADATMDLVIIEWLLKVAKGIHWYIRWIVWALAAVIALVSVIASVQSIINFLG